MNGSAKPSPVLNAALRIAAAGYPVFPCHPDKPQGTPDAKKPLTPHGFKDATTNAKQIIEWWNNWPDALIGMPTGRVSGIDALDIDIKGGKAGFESLAALEAKYGKLPQTRIVQTASGGEHRYFKADQDIETQSSTDRLGKGLDFRGDGGYIIIPPSAGYILTDKSRVADKPDWFTELTRKPEPKPETPPPESDSPYTAEHRLAALQAIPPTEPEGEWIITLMAAKAAGIPKEAVREWAKGSPEQYTDAAFEKHWNSIDADGPVTTGTLIHKARAHGWSDPFHVDPETLDDLINKAGNAADDDTGQPDQNTLRALVAELAKLPELVYVQQRKATAKSINVNPSDLDKEVKRQRAEQAKERAETEQDNWHGLEAWPAKVSLAPLLDLLVATFKRFLSLPPHAATALALWTANT